MIGRICFFLLALAACATPPDQPTPIPSASPVITEPVKPETETPKDIVQRASKAYYGMPGFQTEMRAYQKKGDQVGYAAYDITGKPPRQMRLIVKEGKGSGTKMYWPGGKTVKVRPAGILGIVTLDLDLGDGRLLSTRGYRIDQTDIKSFLDQLSHPKAQFSYVGKGSGYYKLTVTGPMLLSGCVKMDVLLDEQTMLVRSVECTDGKEVVFRMTIQNLKVVNQVSFDI